IPLAISYGVLAVQTGISIGHTLAMSLFIYAGASQFMAVNMLSLGATAAELIMATFVINFRHFVLSFSLMSRLKQVPRPWKAFLSFGITDETFAVSMMKGEEAGQTGALDRGNPPSRPGEELTPAS